MALLKFLKGNYNSLSTKAISEGQILICGDTGEMFVDVAADKRVKIGDFVVMPDVATLEALDASAVPTSRLYYVENGNILARSNGTTWIQINKQKTLAELGGISKEVYDIKMAALDKADTDNANAIAGVDTRLQAAEEKLKSVATTDGLGELADTVAEHTAAIDTINGDAEIEGSMRKIAKDAADAKDAAIKEAKDAADAAQGTVDTLAQTHATDKADLEAAIATKANADDVYTKDDIDAKVDTIDEAIATKANTDDVYTKGDIDGMVDALEAEDERLAGLIGDPTDGKTVVEMIADVESAASEEHERLEGLIGDNADAIAQEVEDREGAIADLKEELEGSIATKVEQSVYDEEVAALAAEDERLAGLIGENATAISDEASRAMGVEESLQTQINTIMNNPDTEGVINSINEFTEYITEHGAIAEGFRADIDANAKAIEDHEALAAQTYETKEDATAKYDELVAKAVQADWNQNDPEAPDYIKNRPFYEESESLTEVILDETIDNFTLEGSTGAYKAEGIQASSDGHSLYQGLSYEIILDGKTYNSVCKKNHYPYIGSQSSPTEEYPFSIYNTYNGENYSFLIRVATPGPHTIKISSVIEHGTLVQLDEKFIPDTIARVADLDAANSELNDAIALKADATALTAAVETLEAADAGIIERVAAVEAQLGDSEVSVPEMINGVQTSIDNHANNDDIHVTTEDKEKWNAAEQNAIDAAATDLATARTEITTEIATAKSEAISDAEGKIATALEAAKTDASNKDAVVLAEAQKSVNAAKTELQSALDTYKTSNDTAVAGKADKATTLAGYGITDAMTADQINEMFTWGEF
jgi:hypothetical protein